MYSRNSFAFLTLAVLTFWKLPSLDCNFLDVAYQPVAQACPPYLEQDKDDDSFEFSIPPAENPIETIGLMLHFLL